MMHSKRGSNLSQAGSAEAKLGCLVGEALRLKPHALRALTDFGTLPLRAAYAEAPNCEGRPRSASSYGGVSAR